MGTSRLRTLSSGQVEASINTSSKTREGEGERAQAEPETTTHTDNSIQTPVLREHGLVVNTLHKILICISCKGAIDPKDTRRHFITYHKDLKTSLDLQKKLDKEVLQQHADLTHFPMHPTTPVEPVKGLADPVTDYQLCRSCGHCYSGIGAFKKHKCTRPGNAMVKTRAQRFINNTMSPWFAVLDEPTKPQTKQDMWSLYISQKEKQPKKLQGAAHHDNYRILHQFLLKERWTNIVEGYSHEDLTPLVAYSIGDLKYGTLSKHVHAFLAATQNSLDGANIRRIIGTRPAEERTDTHVRHHGDVNHQTLIEYSRIVSSLIALIHRKRTTTDAGKVYEINIPNEITEAVNELISKLPTPAQAHQQAEDQFADESGGEDEHEGSNESGKDDDGHAEKVATIQTGKPPPTTPQIQGSLQQLLHAVYTQTPTPGLLGDFFSPVTHFIVLRSLRKNYEWAAANTITHHIAALLFTGRLLFASKIMAESKKNRTNYST